MMASYKEHKSRNTAIIGIIFEGSFLQEMKNRKVKDVVFFT